MLIGFLGAPCSGKTTTAARLFAELKDSGVAAEFIPEQARWYIAHKRLTESDPIVLNDSDQFDIMKKQAKVEGLMASVMGESGLVISDSSPLNSLMYMTEDFREHIASVAVNISKMYDLCFMCHPLPEKHHSSDPNRIHSYEESQKLDSQLEAILKRFAPNLKVVKLFGDSQYRFQEAMRVVNDLLIGL